jgi:hypothetical protein
MHKRKELMDFKTYTKIILFVTLLTLLSCTTKKQAIVPRYYNDVYNFPLKGKVKLLDSKLTILDSTVSEARDYWRAGGFYDGRYYTIARMFDSLGRFYKSFSRRYISTPIKQTDSASIRFYDAKDFEQKRQYVQESYPYNTYNPYALKLNRLSALDVWEGKLIKQDSSDFTSTRHYNYVFDNKSRVLKEYKIYIGYRKYKNIIDTIKRGYVKDPKTGLSLKIPLDWRKKLYRNTPDIIYTIYEVNYKYNAQNQLVSKLYDFSMNKANNITVEIDHDLMAPRRYDTIMEKYTYTDKGLLSTITMSFDDYVPWYEAYTYNKKGKVTKIRRIRLPGSLTIMSSKIKRYKDLYFNDNGDVTKIISYEDDTFKVPYKTYYFVYPVYDEQGNWLKCEIHLDGEIKEQPSKIVERTITYYDN